jgi:hypothetical protein
VTLIVCTFDDTNVELTEDQCDAMYLSARYPAHRLAEAEPANRGRTKTNGRSWRSRRDAFLQTPSMIPMPA